MIVQVRKTLCYARQCMTRKFMTNQSPSGFAESVSSVNLCQKFPSHGQIAAPNTSGIEKICEVFPDLDERIVQNTLHASGHDVAIAIDTLLSTTTDSIGRETCNNSLLAFRFCLILRNVFRNLGKVSHFFMHDNDD